MSDPSGMTNYDLVIKARELARELHQDHTRRSGAPFFEAHLEPVAMMVQEHLWSANAIAAAYLHDAPEDIGMHTREAIGALSLDVLEIVDMLTERGDTWEERKASYTEGVSSMNRDALLVSLCDKIVTGRDFVAEWERGDFGKRPEAILNWYNQISCAYKDQNWELGIGYRTAGFSWLLDELVKIIRKLNDLLPVEC